MASRRTLLSGRCSLDRDPEIRDLRPPSTSCSGTASVPASSTAKTGDLVRARRFSNPDLSPHVSFVDMGGHGYGVVRAAAQQLETEFVCVPRPVSRHDRPDGGPLLYRVTHRVALWRKGETPRLVQTVVEGNPAFSI